MTLARLHNLLLVSIAALVPVYLVRFSIAGIPTNVLELLIIAACIVGITDQALRQHWRRLMNALRWDVKMLVLLFILSAVVSTLISPHLHTSLGILKGWILLPIFYGWMVYACISTDRRRLHEWFLNALTFSASIVSLIGITQLGTMDRITSVYDTPNSLALFVTPILAATVWRTFVTRSWVLGAASIGMFVAVIGSQTVGAVLALLGALGVGGIWLRSPLSSVVRRRIAIATIGIALVGGIFVWDKVEYLTSPQSSAAVRLQLWSVSLDLIQEHPFLGIGLGTFEPAYQQELHERFREYELGARDSRPLSEFVFRDPHNWFLSFWLNVGLLGLVSLGLLLGASLKQSRNYYHPAFIALTATLLAGLVDTIYWKNDLAVIAILFIVLGLAAVRQTAER